MPYTDFKLLLFSLSVLLVYSSTIIIIGIKMLKTRSNKLWFIPAIISFKIAFCHSC